MFNKVLVPLDGSSLAERALFPALALAREPATEVVLFRVAYSEQMLVSEKGVTDARGVVWPEQSTEYSRREAQSYLAALQTAHASPERIVWTKISAEETATPDVAGRIVEFARAEHSDVIVMSSHGRSGLERWMYGSVAERVLSAAPCPVLMVRADQPIKHVLIPLDGSDLAERALPPGLTLAARLGCSVTLLHVAPSVRRVADHEGRLTYHFYGTGLVSDMRLEPKLQNHQNLQDNLRDEARSYLQRIMSHYAHLNVPTQVAVEAGPAAESLLAYTETHPVDCIAMATHGRTGLQRWVYGSVTHKVLRGTRVSMFIVRPGQTPSGR